MYSCYQLSFTKIIERYFLLKYDIKLPRYINEFGFLQQYCEKFVYLKFVFCKQTVQNYALRINKSKGFKKIIKLNKYINKN